MIWQNKMCYLRMKKVYKRDTKRYNEHNKKRKEEKHMLTFLFTFLMLIVFGRILIFAIKATWGISKIVFSLVLLPLCLVGLVLKGLITIALPLLAIIGLVVLIKLAD